MTNSTEREVQKKKLNDYCDKIGACSLPLDEMLIFLGDYEECNLLKELYDKSPLFDESYKGFRDYYM